LVYNRVLIEVFPGIFHSKNEKPFSVEDRRPGQRELAWEAYYAGKMESANKFWKSSGAFPITEILPMVFNILKNNGVEFIRAPYNAMAQVFVCINFCWPIWINLLLDIFMPFILQMIIYFSM
jgi:hypothetical protein